MYGRPRRSVAQDGRTTRSGTASPPVHNAPLRPSPHGFDRVCSNDLVNPTATDEDAGPWPTGARGGERALQRLSDADGGPLRLRRVAQVAPYAGGDAGANWYWYERQTDQSIEADGFGVRAAGVHDLRGVPRVRGDRGVCADGGEQGFRFIRRCPEAHLQTAEPGAVSSNGRPAKQRCIPARSVRRAANRRFALANPIRRAANRRFVPTNPIRRPANRRFASAKPIRRAANCSFASANSIRQARHRRFACTNPIRQKANPLRFERLRIRQPTHPTPASRATKRQRPHGPSPQANYEPRRAAPRAAPTNRVRPGSARRPALRLRAQRVTLGKRHAAHGGTGPTSPPSRSASARPFTCTTSWPSRSAGSSS